jgi:hypothetical protein
MVLDLTINSAFQGVLDVYMATAIAGYTPRYSSWNFLKGNPWPVYADTRSSPVGFEVGGFNLDVFDLLSLTHGRVTRFQIGDVSGTRKTVRMPSYWNGRVAGWNGGSFGSGATVYRATNYDLPAIPGSGYVNPVWAYAFQETWGAGLGPTFEYGWLGNNFYSYKNPAKHVNPGFFFTDNTLHVKMVDTVAYTFAAPLDLATTLPLGQSYNGWVPGSNFLLTSNSVIPNNGLSNTASGSIVYQQISYDNATVNTIMNRQGQGIDLAQSTVFGWLYWWPNFTNGNVTFGGATYKNGLLLVSPDGTKYWWINLIPADAAMAQAIALSHNLLDASAHMTPDGTVWFQSISSDNTKIFTNAAGSPVIKALPIYWAQSLPDNIPDPYEYGVIL